MAKSRSVSFTVYTVNGDSIPEPVLRKIEQAVDRAIADVKSPRVVVSVNRG